MVEWCVEHWFITYCLVTYLMSLLGYTSRRKKFQAGGIELLIAFILVPILTPAAIIFCFIVYLFLGIVYMIRDICKGADYANVG